MASPIKKRSGQGEPMCVGFAGKTVLILTALVLCVPPFAYSQGKQFEDLQQQIDQLKKQLQSIEPKPGPPGPQGPPGPKGEPGLTNGISRVVYGALVPAYDNAAPPGSRWQWARDPSIGSSPQATWDVAPGGTYDANAGFVNIRFSPPFLPDGSSAACIVSPTRGDAEFYVQDLAARLGYVPIYHQSAAPVYKLYWRWEIGNLFHVYSMMWGSYVDQGGNYHTIGVPSAFSFVCFQ